jgi:D-glycero-D-manno-heptose 1,7-bisphosphate phosphatase
MTSRLLPALFLDRDGVINVDRGFVHRADDFEFTPGIFDLVRLAARELRWPVVVATNQSGIGRGLFSEADFAELTEWMCRRFSEEGAPIARVYHCPYHPEAGIGRYRRDHPWRKPAPGMLLQAASDLNLDLAASALLGNDLRDMQAAAAAGISTRIRLGSRGPGDPLVPAHDTVENLHEAAALLRRLALPVGAGKT